MDCEQLAQMLAVPVPEAVVVLTLVGERNADEDTGCIDRLPSAVRIAYMALPIADSVLRSPTERVRGTEPLPAAETGESMPDPQVTRAILIVYDLPDPGQATALGGVVGFGAGQFHARDFGGGAAFMAADATLWGLLVAQAQIPGAIRESVELLAVSTIGLTVSHLVQAAIGGPSARRAARRQLDP